MAEIKHACAVVTCGGAEDAIMIDAAATRLVEQAKAEGRDLPYHDAVVLAIRAQPRGIN